MISGFSVQNYCNNHTIKIKSLFGASVNDRLITVHKLRWIFVENFKKFIGVTTSTSFEGSLKSSDLSHNVLESAGISFSTWTQQLGGREGGQDPQNSDEPTNFSRSFLMNSVIM